METALVSVTTNNETPITNEMNELFAKYSINFKDLSEKKRQAKLFRARVRRENVEAKIRARLDLVWTFINFLFVFGGMLGAYFSKHLLDVFGRKKAFIIHNFFSILGSGSVLVAIPFESTFCIVFSRFLFGIQSGWYPIFFLIYS